jgi:hypothetical protein
VSRIRYVTGLLGQQRTDRRVELFEAKEAPMAQARQYSAAYEQHRQLDPALILRAVRTSRDHHHPVVRGGIRIRALRPSARPSSRTLRLPDCSPINCFNFNMEILSLGMDPAPGGKIPEAYVVRFPINLQPHTPLSMTVNTFPRL